MTDENLNTENEVIQSDADNQPANQELDLSQLSDEELLNAEPTTLTEKVVEHTPNDVQKTSQEVNDEIDYKAFYETMTKPFKANGREMSIANADDAIRLMQMGANYSKKMESLKPNLGLVKLLEQHNLTDVNELGYLLDLHNKKPEAIAKLINDSNVDLYEFDGSIANDYTPSQYDVGVNEPTAFEERLTDILSGNDDNAKAIITELQSWDNDSKNIVFHNPELLDVLSEQKQSGFYDKVVGAIEYERMLGRMTNVSFLQAYSHIEQQLLNSQSNQSFVAPRPTQTNTQNTSQEVDKRKSASIPQSNTVSNVGQLDLSKLSDEELLKLNL